MFACGLEHMGGNFNFFILLLREIIVGHIKQAFKPLLGTEIFVFLLNFSPASIISTTRLNDFHSRNTIITGNIFHAHYTVST